MDSVEEILPRTEIRSEGTENKLFSWLRFFGVVVDLFPLEILDEHVFVNNISKWVVS